MKKCMVVILFFFNFIAATIPHKVVICGVCQNVAKRVTASASIMEKIGNLFSDYRIVVYENNSSDKTPEILRSWAARNPKVFAISEQVPESTLRNQIINRLKTGEFFRPELISRARNCVLDALEQMALDDYEYLIWMDMDFILEPNYEGIKELFITNQPWDAVFAYGVAPDNNHWDWYALRDQVCPYGPEIIGHFWFQPKKLNLRPTDSWYPVFSAFGGFGIYRREAIQGCRYSALVTQDLAISVDRILKQYPQHALTQKYYADLKRLKIMTIDSISSLAPITSDQCGIRIKEIDVPIIWRMNSFTYMYPVVCEHVPFHASMIVNGFDKLYINPRLKFYYGDSYPKNK